MSQKAIILIVFLSLLFVSLSACSTPTPTPAPPTSTPMPTVVPVRAIVYGDISDDPGEVIEGAQPFISYLASQLGDFGITEGQVRVVGNADEMAALLKSGEVDIYCDSVYPATLISDKTGAEIILRRWRFGVETYHSIIFASKASGVTDLKDLAGRFIALDNPFSTSGYVLPAVTLLGESLKMTGKASYEETVAQDEVGFVFSYDDVNTLQWVLSGMVAAGATDDYYYTAQFPAEAKEKLVILAETESVPRQVVMVRPGIDPALLAAIKQAMITAHETAEGQAALETFQTTRFDEFPEGIEAAQARMREMMKLVQDIPLP